MDYLARVTVPPNKINLMVVCMQFWFANTYIVPKGDMFRAIHSLKWCVRVVSLGVNAQVITSRVLQTPGKENGEKTSKGTTGRPHYEKKKLFTAFFSVNSVLLQN